ncbi:hypothetical protein AMECASPLE_017575 [Ameca splendens]|uniref:Secreted protein n=1 Tax=Ameca splendens TaxID=208324 RepID=A0ABV0YE29_9TELE
MWVRCGVRCGFSREKLTSNATETEVNRRGGCVEWMVLLCLSFQVVVCNVGGWTGREAKNRRSGGAVSIPLEVGGFRRLEEALGGENTLKFFNHTKARTQDI